MHAPDTYRSETILEDEIRNLGELRDRHILIISYYFYPSAAVGARRMSELARYLDNLGIDVTVVAASMENQQSGPVGPRSVTVVRIPMPQRRLSALLIQVKKWLTHKRLRSPEKSRDQSNKKRFNENSGSSLNLESGNTSASETFLKRLRRYIDSLLWVNDDKKVWAFKAIWQVRRIKRKHPYDIVISSGPPMSCHLVGLYARLSGNAIWVMDYRDPWVGNLDWIQHVQSPLKRFLESWQEKICMRFAHSSSCTSALIARELISRHSSRAPSITVIHNGYDGEPLLESPPLGKLHLLYAGTIYLNRDPAIIIEALGRLVGDCEIDRNLVSFDIVGHLSNRHRESLLDLVSHFEIGDCISFSDPVPRNEILEYYRKANVLVNLAQGQVTQIPAKMFEYLQQRRDILVVAEQRSATAVLVQDLDWCHVVDGDDLNGLKDLLRRLYTKLVVMQNAPVCKLDEVTQYSRDVANLAFSKLFLSLIGRRP